jgi:hypothetical protein
MKLIGGVRIVANAAVNTHLRYVFDLLSSNKAVSSQKDGDERPLGKEL